MAVFGEITPPPGVAQYGGTGVAPGFITFLSNVFNLLVVVGGIYATINIILAGYEFFAAGGDPKRIKEAWSKIWQSALGLIFIAGAFLLIAIISWVVFGNATAILKPKVYGP